MSEDINKKSFFQMLIKNEKEKADQVYLRQPRNGVWYEFTWQETMRQARKIAAFLQNLGLENGAHISIISKNCAEWFITDFGIHLAGMISIPLFPNQNEANTRYVLEHAEIDLVFVGKLDDHQKVRAYIPEHYKTVGFNYHDDLNVDYLWSDVMATEPLQDIKEPALDELYTVIYSSGTSGTPKGAMYTNQAVANFMHLFPDDIARMRQLKHARLISYMPLAHVYERSNILIGSLTINSDISFVESLDKFAENVREIKPSFFTSVPRIWGVFQQKIEQKLPPRRLNLLLKIPFISSLIKNKIYKGLGFDPYTALISGASHLPISIIKFFDKLGLGIQEGYGQTENLAYGTLSMISERRFGYVGTPRVGVQVKLSEDSELLIYSPCLMLGYYKEDEATKSTFTADGWLKTGDMGEIDSKGRVKVIGRISEKFKNQTGEFVAPAPIEKQFSSNPIIEQICMVGKRLSSNILLVTLNEAVDVSEKTEINSLLQEAVNQVNSKLVKHEKIGHIVVLKDQWTIDNNMLTPTNKIKRTVIEKQFGDLIQFAAAQRQVVVWE